MELATSISQRFDEVYHSAEIFTNDKMQKLPAIAFNDEWISLAPTDQKETIYIRRNGNDEVMEELKMGSCTKSYLMKTPLRVVFFRDHAKDHPIIIGNLMQTVLIGGIKLARIVRDKYKLLKDESTGDYNFGPTTAYFAIDIIAMWELLPSTCGQDICVELPNPLKNELCHAVA